MIDNDTLASILKDILKIYFIVHFELIINLLFIVKLGKLNDFMNFVD